MAFAKQTARAFGFTANVAIQIGISLSCPKGRPKSG